MSENNPYSPPSAEVRDPHEELGELGSPHSVPAGRGRSWVVEGYGYFRQNPGMWILMFILLMGIMMLTSLTALTQLIGTILWPIFIGGVMLACRACDQGEEIEMGHLFAGFRNHGGGLAGIGGLYLLSSIVVGLLIALVLLAVGGLEAMSTAAAGGEIRPEDFGVTVVVVLLLAVMASIPILMAFWFAPPLVAIHGLPAMDALRLSFQGCIRNIWPFLVYGLVALVLGIIAAIPFFLGYLVLSPVLIASIYVGYKDIFLRNPTGQETTQI